MGTLKLTKRTVDALEPQAGRYTVYDADLTGFGVKVLPSGSKSWIVEYRAGAGGRGVAKTRLVLGSTKVLTPDEARRAARDKLADARRGDDPAAKRAAERDTLTLAAVADQFLADVRATKRASTADLYGIYVRVHLLPDFGTRKVTAITRADVAKLHRKIGSTKKVTANRVVATLSGLFVFAQRAGLVPDSFNPTRGIDLFAEEGRERFLTTDELARLGAALREAETTGIARAARGPRSKHAPTERPSVLSPAATGAIRLLLFTGCRLREVLHLRWQDVDLERGLLFLPTSKTGKKTVVLNAPAMEVLAGVPQQGTYVFPGDGVGTAVEKPRADLKRPWALVSERAGLAGLRLHDLRHSFASVGAGSGLGLPIIGKLLGHSQTSTTAKYAHLDADPVRRASNAIGATLASALGEGDSGEVLVFRRRLD